MISLFCQHVVILYLLEHQHYYVALLSHADVSGNTLLIKLYETYKIQALA